MKTKTAKTPAKGRPNANAEATRKLTRAQAEIRRLQAILKVLEGERDRAKEQLALTLTDTDRQQRKLVYKIEALQAASKEAYRHSQQIQSQASSACMNLEILQASCRDKDSEIERLNVELATIRLAAQPTASRRVNAPGWANALRSRA